jgi:hypothetical protein
MNTTPPCNNQTPGLWRGPKANFLGHLGTIQDPHKIRELHV